MSKKQKSDDSQHSSPSTSFSSDYIGILDHYLSCRRLQDRHLTLMLFVLYVIVIMHIMLI